MSLNKNFTKFIRRYKQEQHLSVEKLAEKLCIAKSAAESYLNGTGNPRADTLELLAKRCGVSAAEMISDRPLGWERSEIIRRSAELFSKLPPERRERAINLFLAFIDVLSEEASA